VVVDVRQLSAAIRRTAERWPEGTRETEGIYGRTPLHIAAEWGKTETVRLFLEVWSAGMREKDYHGNIPLHLAAAAGRADVVRLLVERWPEGPREKNEHGDTPLHSAALGRQEDLHIIRSSVHPGWTTDDVLRMLVESWPEGREALNEAGQTPLSLFEEHTCSVVKLRKERKEIIALLGGVCQGQ
jgi:ankyrin repeat protein